MTASLVIKNPSTSPALDERSNAILVDEASNRIPVMAILVPTVLGETSLAANKLKAGRVSQVTGKEQPPELVNSDGRKVPVVALMGVDASNGKPVALKMPAAALADVATLAHKCDGLFASGIRTATGSAENIAHGMATAPSAVLISVYDLNGAAAAVLSEGSHTGTNVIVTVTANVKYKVLAFK